MTNLDELEDLLRKGEKEKAYELVKEDKGITTEILINEGFYSETIEEHSLSILYFELAEKIAANNEIKEMARKNLTVAYLNRGAAHYELKQYEKAIEDYNKAIDLDPNDVGAYNNRGGAYFELNEHKKAIDDSNKAIDLDPNHALAYNNRGLIYYKLKQYEKAIGNYNKAIDLDPKYATAYNNRGTAYGKLKEHDEAIDDYNKAIDLDPNLAEVYNNRGSAHSELKKHDEAIDDYNKAIELNPKFAEVYTNRGITRLQTNEDLDKAIEDFKHARIFFEEKDKERMLGFIEWAKARKAMNLKNWDAFRERMNEAREIFEKINDPLSHSLDALIKFSFTDQDLDDALEIPDPIEASEKIERALKKPPEVEGMIEPEKTIFGARVSSFAILSGFIRSMRSIDENTDLGKVKGELTKLHIESKEVEKLFESVNFDTGKTTIVDLQRIITSVKQEVVKVEEAKNKKQEALEILKKYWLRLSSAIQVMNGISTREFEIETLRRQMSGMESKIDAGFTETKDIILDMSKKSSGEHKTILEKISETKNILLQKDVANARYRIEFQAPLISSLSPISPKIIVDIPMGNLTEEQIEEKAEEITDKIKDLSGKVKNEFLGAIKRVPETGEKLLKWLKKLKG